MKLTAYNINVKHKNKKLMIWIKTTAGAHIIPTAGQVTFLKWRTNLIQYTHAHTHTRARARVCVCVCVSVK